MCARSRDKKKCMQLNKMHFFFYFKRSERLYLKVKEIKNGRLAMIAMLGVFVQGAVTAEGPAANWGKHVANPFGYNFITITAVDRTPVL